VIDHDRVEEHNVSTQLYGEAEIGSFKVEALRNRLFRAAGVEIEAVRKELNAGNVKQLLKDCDLVIDAFDNSASRQLVQDHCRTANVHVLHVGLHADYCEVVWDEHYRVPREWRATCAITRWRGTSCSCRSCWRAKRCCASQATRPRGRDGRRRWATFPCVRSAAGEPLFVARVLTRAFFNTRAVV
jgi:hypothetical protein